MPLTNGWKVQTLIYRKSVSQLRSVKHQGDLLDHVLSTFESLSLHQRLKITIFPLYSFYHTVSAHTIAR